MFPNDLNDSADGSALNQPAAEDESAAGSASPGADDVIELTLATLTSRKPPEDLPLPLPDPPLLPLGKLDPEVLERVVAETVNMANNASVQFYGRRGQKQYGLDVLETFADGRKTVYQVKRYSDLDGLTPDLIESAVEEYASSPATPGQPKPIRRFDAQKFVLVTSAAFDFETNNVDALNALRTKYDGDLELDVWGAEQLSRMLRGRVHIVRAIFGAPWAASFCGFDQRRPVLRRTRTGSFRTRLWFSGSAPNVTRLKQSSQLRRRTRPGYTVE